MLGFHFWHILCFNSPSLRHIVARDVYSHGYVYNSRYFSI
ncbi:hypothetical protein CIT292_07520 [Citrobacter youngae ATCC 29220]|uniref:Uncharacterized protein n=1 Tax=Citrobacter youngae ATCC 29220 TaxID=500640 RepID=D4BAM6_9ENTR|nr:hypothetical protein CIT292_07520 [Citrobacter youngae ATCC 29220]